MEDNHASFSESIEDLIMRLVINAWDQQQGVLLSRLGSEIARKPEIAKAELGGRKLSAYIEDELSGKIRILELPQNPIVKIAVPNEADIDTANLAQYFPRADPGRKIAQASGVSNAILLAFSLPLAEDRKRAITLSPLARFEDLSTDAEVPQSAKVLNREWIVLSSDVPDSNKRIRKILSNISAWREAVGLEPRAIAARSKNDASAAITVLELLISCLSETDQRRIQIPLDIVAQLHNSQVR